MTVYAKITTIVHRDSEPKLQREASVVDIHYRLNGQTDSFTLDNRAWDVRSPWLQFCAVYGWQPTVLSELEDLSDESSSVTSSLCEDVADGVRDSDTSLSRPSVAEREVSSDETPKRTDSKVSPKTTNDVADRDRYLPMKKIADGKLVPDFETVFDGAQETLADAEWFDPDVEIKSTDEGVSGVHGGGSPDPGTGNQGGVDVEAIRDELEDTETDVIEV